jgi:hypothetical protein
MKTISKILLLLLIGTMLVACGDGEKNVVSTDNNVAAPAPSTPAEQNPVSEDSTWNGLKTKVVNKEFATWNTGILFHYQVCDATGSVETDSTLFGLLEYTVDTTGWDCTDDAMQRRESEFVYDGQANITAVHEHLKSIVNSAKYYNNLGSHPKPIFDVLVEEGNQQIMYRFDLNSPLIANPVMKQVNGESLYRGSYYSN